MNDEVNGSEVEIKALIDAVKVKCFDIEFFEFRQNLKNLEIECENLELKNFKNWTKKFENLENYFKTSKVSTLSQFKDKFNDLNKKLPNLSIEFLSQPQK
ncbi:hypothetical protein ACKWTF_014943 [Chironomus riparius]